MPDSLPKPPPRTSVSSHILPTAGTMLGICTTLIGLVKVFESRLVPSQVDQFAGVVAILFLVSALTSYSSIRYAHRPRFSRSMERAADLCFIIGLAGLAAVSLLFAYEVI